MRSIRGWPTQAEGGVDRITQYHPCLLYTSIAYRNLELCFPEKSEQERHRMVVMNFESVGMGLMAVSYTHLKRSASGMLEPRT